MRWGCAVAACLATLIVACSKPSDPALQSPAVAIDAELQRLAGAHTLWPGFDPVAIPLAVYDGTYTILFRHPSPPEGFRVIRKDKPVVYAMDGRHDAMIANSNADIGGVGTATLLADGERGERPAAELAAIAIHESFHVYQRAHHAGWASNEGDLPLYPVDDARLLALRRLETESLRRALSAPTGPDAACWARQAIRARRERFAAMDSAFAAYERGAELNEGLATYVQLRASGKESVDVPKGDFPAREVRQRAYAIGPALAFLLDRFNADWRQSLEVKDGQFLDTMLDAALPPATDELPRCAFGEADLERLETTAQADAVAVSAQRSERRQAFDAAPGWHIVVETSQPLWPNNFDPLNLEVVDGGLLHSRWLRLANNDGSVEALDAENADVAVFTQGPGPHPLFNGVTRASVSTATKPVVAVAGGHVTVTAPGVTIDVQHATVRETSDQVLVRLGSPAP